MKGYASIGYKSVIIGKRNVEGQFSVPESMAGVSRVGTPPTQLLQIDRSATLATVKQYLIKSSGINAAMDLIDLVLTVKTDDGWIDIQALPHGLKDLASVVRHNMTPPKVEAAPVVKAVITDKQQARRSKYQDKQRVKITDAITGESAEVASVSVEAPTKKNRTRVWHDPHDEEDAIPDSQLTPHQLARRKQLEQRAEAQAFGAYRANNTPKKGQR